MSENEELITGFEVEHLANNKTNVANKVLEEISKQLNIYTSTPNRLNIMDLSFLKCYENVVGPGIQAVDCDSGYLSNPLEGSLEKGDPTMFINKSPRFMSDDALQEKPMSVKKTQLNQDVYQEQISYLNSMQDDANVTEGSIVPETDDESEGGGDVSPIVNIARLPVVVTMEMDECSNSSNKENVDVSFATQSMVKMANVKITPRKRRRTPRKRKRSSSSTRSITPKKAYVNNVSADFSPDLFDDEEIKPIETNNKLSESLAATEKYAQKTDQLLMKRINQCMSGVLPPPSVTTTNVTVAQMLEKLNTEKHQVFFWNSSHRSDSTSAGTSSANCSLTGIGSLLVNTDLETCKIREWPNILQDRYHGLNYNHSKEAEDMEALFMKYSQRYIGAETQSSCTIFDSSTSTPSKRKANRLRWVNNSPGRRLSHLARRRITFSSANIQAAGGGSSQSRQIMVDAKRFELLSRRVSPRKGKSPRKTPRKGRTPRKSKTPRKTPNKSASKSKKAMCTPSSSTKKRLAFKVLDEGNSEPSTSTVRASATKRALFQSPDKNITVTRVNKSMLPSTSNTSLSPWKKRSTPKRALFMSPSKHQENNKRKRLDSDDNSENCKFARSLSLQNESQANRSQATLPRVKSESLLRGHAMELSDHHKKKLQWAVYEALRGVNIRVDHEKFRQFASVLARVTRRLLPTVANASTGTSERMLRITKQHVYAVIKGKSMEEIVKNYESSRMRIQKPTGYVRKEETKDTKDRVDVATARSNVFQDCANTIQSSEKKNVAAVVDKKVVAENKIDRVKKIIKF